MIPLLDSSTKIQNQWDYLRYIKIYIVTLVIPTLGIIIYFQILYRLTFFAQNSFATRILIKFCIRSDVTMLLSVNSSIEIEVYVKFRPKEIVRTYVYWLIATTIDEIFIFVKRINNTGIINSIINNVLFLKSSLNIQNVHNLKLILIYIIVKLKNDYKWAICQNLWLSRSKIQVQFHTQKRRWTFYARDPIKFIAQDWIFIKTRYQVKVFDDYLIFDTRVLINFCKLHFSTLIFRQIRLKIAIIDNHNLNDAVSQQYSKKISLFESNSLCKSFEKSPKSTSFFAQQSIRFAQFFKYSSTSRGF